MGRRPVPGIDRALDGVRAAVPLSVKQPVRRALDRARGRREIHVLHIGKTGGTALKHALGSVSLDPKTTLHLHSHSVALWDVPLGSPVIAVVRDPAERFVSAFWSRHRMGRPRYDKAWSDAEAEAFAAFATPEALACALSDDDELRRRTAIAAMESIGHVRTRLGHWLGSPGYLQSRADDFLWIGGLEQLEAELSAIGERLGGVELQMPEDPVQAHRNPESVDRGLTPVARRNLRLWYADDYTLVDVVQAIRHDAF